MTQKTISRPLARNRSRQGARNVVYQPKRTLSADRTRKTRGGAYGAAKSTKGRGRSTQNGKSSSAAKAKRGASGLKHGAWKQLMVLHIRQALDSWCKLWQAPVSSLFTVLVLGLVLALPTLFHVSLNNFESVMAGWSTSDKISVFIDRNLSEDSVHRIKMRIQSHVSVQSVEYISPEQGLQEFKARSGLTRLINAMERNPLPAVLEVVPVDNMKLADIKRLAGQIARFRGVESVKQDEIWVQRLHAFIDLGKHITWALAAVLGVTVFLSIANTIRLLVINRQEEIRIVRLVGGSKGYVMLPFVYSGVWYGLLSSLFACVISVLLFIAMTDSVKDLASLYHSSFKPHFLSGSEMITLVVTAVFISVMGALLATNRQLKKLDAQGR